MESSHYLTGSWKPTRTLQNGRAANLIGGGLSYIGRLANATQIIGVVHIISVSPMYGVYNILFNLLLAIFTPYSSTKSNAKKKKERKKDWNLVVLLQGERCRGTGTILFC